VFLDSLDSSDLLFIATSMYPRISPEILENMIRFNSQVFEDTMVTCKYGRKGSPWEFNLRDIFRWCDLLSAHPGSNPADFVDLVYLQRMRTISDRTALLETYQKIMGHMPKIDTNPYYHATPTTFQVGNSLLSRSKSGYISNPRKLEVLHQFLNPIENIMKCIEMNWMCIITGPTASGKTSMIRLLSQITRNTLYEFAMNTSVDTTELLGGFEQVDFTRYRKQIIASVDQLLEKLTEYLLLQIKENTQLLTEIHNLWSMFLIRARFPKK
jgi:midasin